MTVIVYDGLYVASDSQEIFGHSRQLRPAEKLRRQGHRVFAFCGSSPLFDPMIKWYMAGHKPEDVPKVGEDDHSTLFVFEAEKAAFVKTDLPYPEEILSPGAWGTAAEYAITALDCGKSAEEAVEMAIARCVWLGGPVQVIDLTELRGNSAHLKKDHAA